MNKLERALLAGALMMATEWSAPHSSRGAVTVHVPGYVYSPFITASRVSDLELDAVGNLYLCESGNIQRVTPDGTISPWSTATSFDLAMASNGTTYGAGRASCHCIVSISPAGMSSPLHQDSFEWTYVAMGSDGTLYSSIWVGDGQGLYAIDRTTGMPTTIVSGGPGVGGIGAYFGGMIVGTDGKLYTGAVSSGSSLFRLDGTQFTPVASIPIQGRGLAQDGEGILYVTASYESMVGRHEVWMIDPSTGSSTLLAEGSRGADGLAYDGVRGRLYVGLSSGEVYFLTKSVVPTRRSTWGAIKSLYR